MHPRSLILRKDQERRLLAGHCWIYSNEVDDDATPLRSFTPGQGVEVFSQRGRWLGYGYVNPHSLICARLVSRNRAQPPGPAFWLRRLHQALNLRERLYDQPFYRLVFSEGDGLPGLIVDRYDDLLAVQITTAGMEAVRAEILTALEQLIRPQAIVLRNDTPVRELEGLPQGVEWVLGAPRAEIQVIEEGLAFAIDPTRGQKTGWFFDQAENRRRLARYRVGSRVLDVFCYVGAWGLRAAALGAQEVLCLDSSAEALERLAANAARTGFAHRIRIGHGDAFEQLRNLRDQGERFDTVILDPPAFIKRRKDTPEGLAAYRQLNRLGLELLAPEGLLITSSCSFHLERETFQRLIQQAAQRAGQRIQILEVGQQGPDHPIHPAIPEAAYLKTFMLRALPADA